MEQRNKLFELAWTDAKQDCATFGSIDYDDDARERSLRTTHECGSGDTVVDKLFWELELVKWEVKLPAED